MARYLDIEAEAVDEESDDEEGDDYGEFTLDAHFTYSQSNIDDDFINDDVEYRRSAASVLLHDQPVRSSKPSPWEALIRRYASLDANIDDESEHGSSDDEANPSPRTFHHPPDLLKASLLPTAEDASLWRVKTVVSFAFPTFIPLLILPSSRKARRTKRFSL